MAEPVEHPPLKLSNPQKDILRSRQKLNLFLAGQGAGKTFLMAVLAYYYLSTFKGISIFIGANTHLQLTDSTLKGIFKVWKKYFRLKEYDNRTGEGHYTVNVIPPASFNVDPGMFTNWHGKICFAWGSVAYIGSLENYKAHDGKEFAVALLDETKDTRPEALFDVILGRLREQKVYIDTDGKLVNFKTPQSFNPLYIFTSPAKVEWLNELFTLEEYIEEILDQAHSETTYFKKAFANKFVTISSTYHNQINLPENYISEQKSTLNPHLIDMLIYGIPFAKTGGEYAHQFERTKHVKKVPFLDQAGLPIHLTLDFNVTPYMTGICAQLITEDNRKKLRLFREYCLEPPRNSTEDICSALVAEYGHRMKGLFYYGDPSGRNRQTVTKEYTDNYHVVGKKLRKYLNNKSDRVLPSHPGLLKSRDFLNNMLAGVYGIDLEIDDSLTHLIADLEHGKEDVNGGILKEMATNAVTGKKYQKYGHATDALRYLLCAIFNNIYDSL